MQKKQISYFLISPYFWYAMFECFPSTKMQKTFVLQFVLGSHTILLDLIPNMVIWVKNVNIFKNDFKIVNMTANFNRHTIKAQVCQISKQLDQ